MRILSIAFFLLLCCCPGLRAQSVKEVMQDKSGKYLYAMARDSDIKVAYELANDELLKQVNQWSAATGVAVPTEITEVQGHIRRINGEVLGQHRVFLFVDTETLRSGVAAEAPQETHPASATAILQEEKPAPVEPEYEAPAEILASVSEQPVETEYVQEFAEPEPVELVGIVQESGEPEAEEEPEELWYEPAPAGVTEYIPSGRLGSTISALLRCHSEREVVECLAKLKTSKGVSVYGKGYSKYADHAFLVSVSNGVVRVLSPRLTNGTRTEYPTGKSVAAPTALNSYYWFLKK